jgi:rhodanese-related sulfurtransferase
MMWRRVAALAAASSSSAVGASSRCASLRFSALAFCPSNHPKNQQQKCSQVTPPTFLHKNNERFSITTTTRQMSFFGGASEGITRINKEAMTEIIEDVSSTSREESGYVIIDVRGHDEIAYTGKLNDCVETLPLPYIAQGALAMEEEDFKEAFGFDKPGLDETIVFSCKAGIRSQQAGQLAKMAGYTDILDYMGGSNEWFS